MRRKRLWLIPCVVFLALLASYPFRWGDGPTRAVGGTVTKYTKDRWTGDWWIEVYSPYRGVWVVPAVDTGKDTIQFEGMVLTPSWTDAEKTRIAEERARISNRQVCATSIWAALLVISGAAAVYLFLREGENSLARVKGP